MRIAQKAKQKAEWQKNNPKAGKNSESFVDSTPANEGKEWVSYKLDGTMDFHQRQRYEWFCAGFLLYYDDIIRNALVDHIMTFEWADDKVTINLSPEAARRKDKEEDYLKYPNLLYPKWKDPKDLLSAFDITTSDPPPPPPPPPPPM